METSPPLNNGQAQRAALNQYDELLKRVADRDPSAVQEADRPSIHVENLHRMKHG